MTISLWTAMSIVIAHYLGDWRLQTDWMATNKSKWWQSVDGLWALTLHVLIYSTTIALLIGGTNLNSLKWFGITFVTHWVTDAITSQFTTRWFFIKNVHGCYRHDGAYGPNLDHVGCDPYWAFIPENRPKFFNTIGVDQSIHFITLLWTLHILSR